jgi:tripeptide aminopeptidase
VDSQSDSLQLFLELAATPSPPGEERAVADIVLRYLRDLGLDADEDDAGQEIGSTAGNVYARLEPTADGTPLFLCAHFDTVPPDGRLEPVVDDDGIVRNAGGTILGADNKSAIVSMLEGVRRVLAENRPHAGIELVFTPKEEVGLIGAYAFDHDRLQAQVGYVYDQAAPIGEIILGAPWSQSMEVRFHGRAAHAGMFPEEGRSAIQAAAKAIADLRLGRVDEDTTANVGVISGGTGGNIVPEWCRFLAEARSQDESKLKAIVQEMVDAFSFAATATDCEVEVKVRKSYTGYRFRREDDAVQLAARALGQCGYSPSYALSGGGADANVFNERGRRCVNLANGMTDIHTPDERIAVADLDAMADVTLALVDAARA